MKSLTITEVRRNQAKRATTTTFRIERILDNGSAADKRYSIDTMHPGLKGTDPHAALAQYARTQGIEDYTLCGQFTMTTRKAQYRAITA